MSSINSAIEVHKKNFDRCYKCEIGKLCSARIYYRGVLPSDIVIIGEAAGDIEWSLKTPWVGPAGHLLNTMIEEVFGTANLEDLASTPAGYRISLTNSIACIPQEPRATKLREPKNVELKNCAERLDSFLDIAKPRVIIAAGKVAEKQYRNLKKDYHLITMMHPSAILRQQERGELDYKRSILALTQAKDYVTL